MAGKVEVITSSTKLYGLTAIATIPGVNSNIAIVGAKFPLPKPFEAIQAWFTFETTPCGYLYTSANRPDNLNFKLSIRGKQAGWHYDLSKHFDNTRFGLTVWPSDFAEKWIQEDGSVILECEITPNQQAYVNVASIHGDLMLKTFEAEGFVDFELVCERKTIKVAKAIIGPKSEFLRALFESKMKESKAGKAEIKNMSFNTLQLLVKYLYSGNIDGQFINRDVLIAADYLNIANVKGIYEIYISKNLTLENVDQTLLNAEEFALPALTEKCFQFLARNNNWQPGYKKMLTFLRKVKISK